MQNADPSNLPRWGLAAALAWVGSRSLETVALCAGRRLEEVDFRMVIAHQDAAWRKAFSDDPVWASFETAHWDRGVTGPPDPWAFTDNLLRSPPNDKEALLNALRDGEKVKSWGELAHGNDAGKTVAIPSVEWDTMKPGDIDTACTRYGVVEYRNVRVDRAALLVAFPQKPDASLVASKPDAQKSLTGRKRGPKEKYPWHQFFAQCEVYWSENDDGWWEDGRSFIESPAPLVKLMTDWCARRPVKQWGDGPSSSQLREKINEFLARKSKEAH